MQYTKICLALKIENFQLKNFDIFLIFAQNIDCGYTLEPPRRGDSNEYPQSMFWSKNKKNRYTLRTPVFYIKVGFKGVYITRTCFPDVNKAVNRKSNNNILCLIMLNHSVCYSHMNRKALRLV